MAGRFDFGNSAEHEAWLAQVTEPVIEPERPIVDAHHHLWMRTGTPYLLPEYLEDLHTGHNVVATVYAQCHSMYRQRGPEAMRPVGESEFVAGVAAMSDSGQFGETRICAAMVGAVDMSLGFDVEPILRAHQVASGGRFRGIRISSVWHEDERLRHEHGAHYLREPAVRDAISVLQAQDMSLDVWAYHTQLDEVAEVAKAHPQLPIVLNHVGVPIVGGPYRGREDVAMAEWRIGMQALAECANVVVKLGALPIRSKDRADPDRPPTSTDLLNSWGPWMTASIDLFGAARCMFESNFPVHKNWVSYSVLWNAFKRIAAPMAEADKTELFSGTASRVYGITT